MKTILRQIPKTIIGLSLGIILSLTFITAYAALVSGTPYNFTLGSQGYTNSASLSNGITAKTLRPGCSVGTSNGASMPTGYFGTSPCVVRSTDSVIVYRVAMSYTPCACSAYINAGTYSGVLPSGYYYGQGETKVYYNGIYQTYWTYGTPYLLN